MVIFDPQKALQEWKKAKPLLLTETGVSGTLRALPSKPKQPQLKLYVSAMSKLEKSMADPKLRKEKKALACLQTIQTSMEHFLANIQSERKETIKAFKALCQLISEFNAIVSKGPPTRAEVDAFDTKWRVAKRGWNENFDVAAVPDTLHEQIKGGFYCLDKGTQGLLATLVEIERVKEAQVALEKEAAKLKLPKPGKLKMGWDVKTETAKDLALLKKALQLLQGVNSTLIGLNP